MNRSELIDHRISNLCTERVCVSRLAWFHPSQTEIRDRCVSVMKQTYPEVELVFGASSQSYKARADFVKASFDAQCSKESRYSIPYCTVWKSFLSVLLTVISITTQQKTLCSVGHGTSIFFTMKARSSGSLRCTTSLKSLQNVSRLEILRRIA